MARNGYEIRLHLLEQASNTLHDHWRVAQDVERESAHREERGAKTLTPPTQEEVQNLATSMYTFVQTKGTEITG